MSKFTLQSNVSFNNRLYKGKKVVKSSSSVFDWMRLGIEVLGVSAFVLAVIATSGLTRGASKPNLEVRVESDSTVRAGDKLYEGMSARTGEDGYILYRFKPWYNPNIEQYSCTDLRVDRLRNLGVGVELKLEYRGIVFCPYKAAIRVISPNYKSPKSQVKVENKLENGLVVNAVFRRGEGQFSYDKNNLPMIGSAVGVPVEVGVRLLTAGHLAEVDRTIVNKSKRLENREYVKVDEEGSIGESLVAEAPFLEVRENRGNGQVRLCSHVDNQVFSLLKKSEQEREEETCVETVVGDRLRVLNPIGESTKFRVVFKENPIINTNVGNAL